MNAVGDLVTVIHRRLCEDSLSECLEDGGHCVKAAAEILAAGYRKPRTILTLGDLSMLKASATVLSANGVVWVNDGDHANPWASVVEDPQGGPVWADDIDIALPATVLHEGTRP